MPAIDRLSNIQNTMKNKYNKETDMLYIRIKDVVIDESKKDKKGVRLDYSEDRHLVDIEVLNPSRSMDLPSKIEYEMARISSTV